MDMDWAPALTKASLHVDPLPKLILRAPTDRPSHTNPDQLTKVGFQYVIAHKKASGFYWNKSVAGSQSHVPNNQYPIDSQVISHVPSVKTAKKLRLPGSGQIARPQENSPEEVSIRSDNVYRQCGCNYRILRDLSGGGLCRILNLLFDTNTYHLLQSLELVRQYGPPGGIMVDCYAGTMVTAQAALRYV